MNKLVFNGLTFKVIKNGVEKEYKYNKPENFIDKVDFGFDDENFDIPLAGQVIELKYYNLKISLKEESIKEVLDIYDFCCERDYRVLKTDIK